MAMMLMVLVALVVSMADPLVALFGIFMGYLWHRTGWELPTALLTIGTLGWLSAHALDTSERDVFYALVQVAAACAWTAIAALGLRIWKRQQPAAEPPSDPQP